MSEWGTHKAREVYNALIRIGWSLKREAKRSHRILSKQGWPDFIFAFHEGEEIGPRMLARISKKTSLQQQDL